jgi:hypothetical protein
MIELSQTSIEADKIVIFLKRNIELGACDD